jgi:type IV pilus assembly protein PilW
VMQTRTQRSALRGSGPARRAGFTLVELMVALVIGALSVLAALEVYARGRDLYRVNERLARMQEQGRVALSVIEPDIELAGYYGFTQSADVVRLVSGGNSDIVLATSAQMRQWPFGATEPLPAAVAGLPAGAHTCGVNFAVDLSTSVQGSNGAFAFGRSPAGPCNPYQGRAQLGADTLTMRRVQTQSSPAEGGRLQVYASRHTSRSSQWLFADGTPPGPVDDDHRVHNVVVRGYYIARDSVGQRDYPALRVKALTRSGASLVFDDEEVMTGVEDLQVQFGISAPGDVPGRVARYVDPDFPELASAQVVAVRLWLRIRADEPEPFFTDTKIYSYADVSYTPAGTARNFRRVLMTRTITLRNARAT